VLHHETGSTDALFRVRVGFCHARRAARASVGYLLRELRRLAPRPACSRLPRDQAAKSRALISTASKWS